MLYDYSLKLYIFSSKITMKLGHLLCVDRTSSEKTELVLKLLENRPIEQLFLFCPTTRT